MTSQTISVTETVNEREKFPLIWDSSIRKAFVSCPRKFYWEYIRGLRNPTPSIHLHFGKAFAAGLDTFRKAFYGLKLPFEESEILGAKRILLEWGNFEDPNFPGHNYKTLETCLEGFRAYLQNWPPQTDLIQPLVYGDTPTVEFSFALPLPIRHPVTDEPLIFAGRFDMLGIFNNQLFVTDEKTTSRLGQQWNQQWNMRGQFLGYMKAAQEHDIKVAGAVVRGISILKSSFGFAEVILPLKQWKVDQWYNQFLFDVQKAVDYWNEGFFPQSFDDACTSYSGCSYEQLCDSPEPERWTSNFIVERWDPLAQRVGADKC